MWRTSLRIAEAVALLYRCCSWCTKKRYRVFGRVGQQAEVCLAEGRAVKKLQQSIDPTLTEQVMSPVRRAAVQVGAGVLLW